MRKYIGLMGCGLVTACSGGGNSSAPSAVVEPAVVVMPPVVVEPPVVVVPPVPTLAVTLKPSATAETVTEANSVTSLSVQADFSGSSSDTIVPQVDYDRTTLALDGDIVQSGNSFTAKFKTLTGLSAKTYANTISFRLCKDSACETVYPGSTQAFVYTLTVPIADWTTRQRNPAHNGYVHATFDPTTFAKAWEYTSASAIAFDAAAARRGTVFLTERRSDGSTTALALDGVTGAERWRYSIGNVSDASGPALSGNQVVFSTMFSSSGTNPLLLLNADTGQFIQNLTFAAQWSTFAQPTPIDTSIYIAAGYYGNVVYAYDATSRAAQWSRLGSRGSTWDGQAPAADSRYVYYYSGNLDVIDRQSGALISSIADPFWVWNGYSYGGTPMVGAANHVIAYSGNGMGTYAVSFPLVDYDVAAGTYRWRTASSYSVIPADAKAVVYAASNQTAEFDAIDEATGKVLWAWPRPANEQFVGNIVVTDTLAFLSTNRATYAVALDGTHETKWSAGTPGALVITPDGKLVVTPVASNAGAKVTAYTLR